MHVRKISCFNESIASAYTNKLILRITDFPNHFVGGGGGKNIKSVRITVLFCFYIPKFSHHSKYRDCSTMMYTTLFTGLQQYNVINFLIPRSNLFLSCRIFQQNN